MQLQTSIHIQPPLYHRTRHQRSVSICKELSFLGCRVFFCSPEVQPYASMAISCYLMLSQALMSLQSRHISATATIATVNGVLLQSLQGITSRHGSSLYWKSNSKSLVSLGRQLLRQLQVLPGFFSMAMGWPQNYTTIFRPSGPAPANAVGAILREDRRACGRP